VSAPDRAWLADAVLWDNHACMPLRADDSFLPQLERCRQAALTLVTLNVGFDLTSFEQNLRVLAHFRQFVQRHADRYQLVHTLTDIYAAKRSGRLGICFNLEGTRALGDQLSMIELFYALGVKWMLMAYNRDNSVGGGYELIKACAATHGVVGINGVTPFLGAHVDLDRAVAAMFRHIDHVVQLVGPDYAGVALDYVFDMQELYDYFSASSALFPPEKGYDQGFQFVPPEQLAALVDVMLDHGYPRAAILNIMGGITCELLPRFGNEIQE
jgi:microsomal dipeptidase-like Zn-dependent dipeptidase